MNIRIKCLPLVFLIILVACSEDPVANNTPTPIETDDRYNALVFSNFQKSENVQYGQNITQGGQDKNLLLDIYEPNADTASRRPLVILIHGGGFEAGDKESLTELASFLARSGYVAASINYRLIDLERTLTRLSRGIMDAVFDAKAAVRFFRKDASTNNTYRIDTNNIFLGGFSAGAFTALHYAYVNSPEEIESIGGNTLLNYINSQGGLAGNSGNAGFSSAIKGVFNVSGALVQADFLDAGEPILFSAHATNDLIVPYLEGESDGSGLITQGSGLIHPIANQLGVTNTLKTLNEGGHGAFFNSCPTCEADLRNFLFQNL